MAIKYPYTDFHEMNLDWVLNTVKEVKAIADDAATKEWVLEYFSDMNIQDEVNNKIDIMAANGSLQSILQSLIYNFVDVVDAGVDNTGEDCTAALQACVDANPGKILYFRSGIYNVKDTVTVNEAVCFLLEDDAVVKSDRTDDFAFNVTANGFKMYGGQLEGGNMDDFTNRNLVGTLQGTGFFKFDNCEDITIENVKINFNSIPYVFRVVQCANVSFKRIAAENILHTCIGFLNGGLNLKVSDSCFVHVKHSSGQQYCYPISTGYSDYTNTYSMVSNFTVENCYMEDCDWEGLDCHGGKDVIFRNIRMKNCNRFITCYPDTRPVLDNEDFGNVIIENCWLENEADYNNINTDTAMYLNGTGERYLDGVIIRNITMINPVTRTANGQTSNGAIMTNFNRNVKIEHVKLVITAVFGYAPVPLIIGGVSNIDVDGLEIIGFPGLGSTGIIRFNACSGKIDNVNAHVNSTTYAAIRFVSACKIDVGNNIITNTTRKVWADRNQFLIADGENIPAKFNDMRPSEMFGSNDGTSKRGFATTLAAGDTQPSQSVTAVDGNPKIELPVYYFCPVGTCVTLSDGNNSLTTMVRGIGAEYVVLETAPNWSGSSTLTIERMSRYNYGAIT